MPTSDWAPTLADVGETLRARTKDTNGVELGTFTAATRPNNDQATIAIAKAVRDVADQIGDNIDVAFWSSAKYLTALGAAMLIELSYFPDQVATGRSPYEQLKDLYDERLGRLVVSMADFASGSDSDRADDLRGRHSFPDSTVMTPVGWLSRW